MRSARFRLMPGMTRPLSRGFLNVHFDFFRDLPSKLGSRRILAHTQPGYANIMIAYPRDETPADQRLKPTDGTFVIPIEAADYPSIALRYGLESHSAALLGISRDGRVKSCRPINGRGPGTAFLDNYSCMLFLRRGRFQFAPGAPSYRGLRYLTKGLGWSIPN